MIEKNLRSKVKSEEIIFLSTVSSECYRSVENQNYSILSLNYFVDSAK